MGCWDQRVQLAPSAMQEQDVSACMHAGAVPKALSGGLPSAASTLSDLVENMERSCSGEEKTVESC